MVRLAAFHDLPSAFTHHLWFSFFYSTDAYVRLSVWMLHEQNGEAEESGIVPGLGACELVVGLRQVHGRQAECDRG